MSPFVARPIPKRRIEMGHIAKEKFVIRKERRTKEKQNRCTEAGNSSQRNWRKAFVWFAA